MIGKGFGAGATQICFLPRVFGIAFGIFVYLCEQNDLDMDDIFPQMTDRDIRIWCAEQCRNNNGELNLEKAKELYRFVTQTEAQ